MALNSLTLNLDIMIIYKSVHVQMEKVKAATPDHWLEAVAHYSQLTTDLYKNKVSYCTVSRQRPFFAASHNGK